MLKKKQNQIRITIFHKNSNDVDCFHCVCWSQLQSSKEIAKIKCAGEATTHWSNSQHFSMLKNFTEQFEEEGLLFKMSICYHNNDQYSNQFCKADMYLQIN